MSWGKSQAVELLSRLPSVIFSRGASWVTSGGMSLKIGGRVVGSVGKILSSMLHVARGHGCGVNGCRKWGVEGWEGGSKEATSARSQRVVWQWG